MNSVQAPRSLIALVAAGKLYSRPLRQQIRPHPGGGRGLLLGPVAQGERRVLLRSPRLSDASAWRTIRLRDRELIEPFWVSSGQPWTLRHTERAWVEEVLGARKDARAGRALSLVIEVDGRFSGQFHLANIDTWAHSGEIGVWLDSTLVGRGIILAAGTLLGDHLFGQLGLRRVTAPVCVDNLPASRLVKQFGMRREGTMASYLDVGGQRKDHDLWAITSEMWAARGSAPALR